MRSPRHLQFLLLATAVFLYAASVPAEASSISYPGSNRGVVTPSGLTSLDAANRAIERASASSLTVSDKINALIGSKEVPMQAKRTLTTAGVAKALARGGARAIPAVATAASMAAVLCLLSGSGWMCDPFQEKAEDVGASASCFSSTRVEARTPEVVYRMCAYRFLQHRINTGSPWDTEYTLHGSPTCVWSTGTGSWQCSGMYVKEDWLPGISYDAIASYDASVEKKTVRICPEDTEEIDGKCSTGTYEPATETDLQTRVHPALQPHLETVVRDALQRGVDFTPEATPAGVTGPASVQQPAKTSTLTSPTGTPQTRTEQTTNHITYGPQHFTWVNTTVINNYDGSEEVIEEEPKPDEKSECEKNPESLPCKELDTPDGPEIEEKDHNVEFNPDDGWGSDGGSCPAPRSLSIHGQLVTIDNTLTCGFLTGIRPAVIAAFGVVGVFLFVGGLRQ